MDKIIFHLAIPITDVDTAKRYYGDVLGAKVGRENKHAVIFNFYGHQLVGHTDKDELTEQSGIYPRHFGIIFTDESDWEDLLNKCHDRDLPLYEEARLRFAGKITEHRTFFLEDPFHNIMEFKFYRHYEAIFGASQFVAIGDR